MLHGRRRGCEALVRGQNQPVLHVRSLLGT
jgi:hypothetical protein